MMSQDVLYKKPVMYVHQTPITAGPIGEVSLNHIQLFNKLGITQIIIGCFCFVAGIFLLIFTFINQGYGGVTNPVLFYFDLYGQIGTGIWTSCFFFTTGLLGVMSSRKKTRCLVISSMTLAIFSTLAAATLCGLEIAAAVFSFRNTFNFGYFIDWRWGVSFGLHLTLAFVAFAEFVISIIHASYCCKWSGYLSQSCCFSAEQIYIDEMTFTRDNSNSHLQEPKSRLAENWSFQEKNYQDQQIVYNSKHTMAKDQIDESSEKYGSLFFRLGITQIVLSVIMLSFGISLVLFSTLFGNYYDIFGKIAGGVWGASFFFTSGILGVLSGKRKSRCLVISSLVMAIIAAVVAGVLCGLEIAGAIFSYFSVYFGNLQMVLGFAFHIVLAVLAFTEIVISIIHASFYCCCGCCGPSNGCCMPSSQINPVYETTAYKNSDAFALETRNSAIQIPCAQEFSSRKEAMQPQGYMTSPYYNRRSLAYQSSEMF